MATCNNDSDCPEGYICKNGTCLFYVPGSGCGSDADCPEGYFCIDGNCKKRRQEDVACSSDSDCPEGFVCINGECAGQECSSKADCPQGYNCVDGRCSPRYRVSCQADADCPQGFICVNGECTEDPDYQDEGSDGDGGGDGDGEQLFGWSGSVQDLISRILERANYLLDYPMGTSPEERQAIINFAKKGIMRSERGDIQSIIDRMSRQGLAESPFIESEIGKRERFTGEQLGDLQSKVMIDEMDRRYNQLMGTTGMAQSLLGTGMTAEKLVEALNAARRGEGSTALSQLLAYMNSIGGMNQGYSNLWGSLAGSQMGGSNYDIWSWLPYLSYFLGNQISPGSLGG